MKLVLDSKPVMKKARNVLAQTKSGDTKNVVMVGAHLDSSARSPGINDDGSGLAAVLETAAALGSQPQITNAVRFAFWGSEENALGGSAKYVRGLGPDQLDEIALYLNLDMIGSPNAGYFTYDGDQSGQPNPEIPLSAIPQGSAGIERTLAGYLNTAGVRPADMPLTSFTDYHAFLTAGVPIGGLTAGGSQRKSEVQARLWGGRRGVPFDPNYRTPKDTIDNIDRNALAVMGRRRRSRSAPTRSRSRGSTVFRRGISGIGALPSLPEAQQSRNQSSRSSGVTTKSWSDRASIRVHVNPAML